MVVPMVEEACYDRGATAVALVFLGCIFFSENVRDSSLTTNSSKCSVFVFLAMYVFSVVYLYIINRPWDGPSGILYLHTVALFFFFSPKNQVVGVRV